MLTTTSIKAFLATQRGRNQFKSALVKAKINKNNRALIKNRNGRFFLAVDVNEKGNLVVIDVTTYPLKNVTRKVKKALGV